MCYKTLHVTRPLYLHYHVVTLRGLLLWLGLRERIFEMHVSRLSTAALSDSIIKDKFAGQEIYSKRDGWLQDKTS